MCHSNIDDKAELTLRKKNMMAETKPSSHLSIRYTRAHAFLRSVVALVAVYGIGMVTAGRIFAANLFDLLGFGPNARGLDSDGVTYSIFAFSVIGAVIAGWMVLLLFVVGFVASPDRDTRAAARRAMALSVTIWFTLDTGFSLATGEVEHAAFNLPFMTLLAVPLYIMTKSDTVDDKKRA